MLPKIMDPWQPPFRGDDGALLEKGPQTEL